MSSTTRKPVSLLQEALDHTVITNKHLPSIIGIWSLLQTSERVPESPLSLNYTSDSGAFEFDAERKKVHPSDFAEGGKYRSIVKLFVKYEDQAWATATGFLIAPDLIVTAGHCAFDWSHSLGAATKIKAYIGYNGRSSVGHSSVQFRQGKRIAAPAEWLKGPSMPYDVAFIALDKPFTGVRSMTYDDTPASGHCDIGIVGYPAEVGRGESMYELFEEAKWDLKTSGKMLTYSVDASGGCTGAPVLKVGSLTAIGVHAYGGAINKGTVIGHMGIVFANYAQALHTHVSGKTTSRGIHFLAVSPAAERVSHRHAQEYDFSSNGYQNTTSIYNNGYKPATSSTKMVRSRSNTPVFREPTYLAQISHFEDAYEEAFDFSIILKKGVRIAAPIVDDVLAVASPVVMGHLGAPIAALASVALGVVGRAATAAESAEVMGLAERAILGEAALQCIMNMNELTLKEERVFDIMAQVVKKNAPIIKKAAPHIMNAVMPIAMNVALDSLHKSTTNTDSGFESFPTESIHDTYTNGNSTPLIAPFSPDILHALSTSNTESFISALLSVLKTTSPILGKAASTGLPLFVSSLNSASQTPTAMDGLAERALLQEAALVAISQIPKYLLQDDGSFEIFKSVILTVGPVVVKAAPSVINATKPLVGPSRAESLAVPGGRGRVLRKQRSAVFGQVGRDGGFVEAYNGWAESHGESTIAVPVRVGRERSPLNVY